MVEFNIDPNKLPDYSDQIKVMEHKRAYLDRLYGSIERMLRTKDGPAILADMKRRGAKFAEAWAIEENEELRVLRERVKAMEAENAEFAAYASEAHRLMRQYVTYIEASILIKEEEEERRRRALAT